MNEIILITIGFIFLIKGSDVLIDGAESIAQKLKIPEIVIGLTIVAFGTSLPELIVSINSVKKGYDELLLGNIIGSCIYNLLLILGVIFIIKPIKIKSEPQGNLIIQIASLLTIAVFCNMGMEISRIEGILLILIFIIFLLGTFSEKTEVVEERKNIRTTKSIGYIIMGSILLKLGGDFVVNNSVQLAEKFNIAKSIIGSSIVALGTSLPELVTSIVAIRKDKENIAIGNVVGSNIFNLLLVLGITSIIHPIKYDISYNTSLIFLLIVILLMYIFIIIKNKETVNRKEGIALIITFIMYNIKMLL